MVKSFGEWMVHIVESIPFQLLVSVVFLSPHIHMSSSFSASDLGNKRSNSAQFDCMQYR
jgi:hypothetical protein